MLDGGCVRGCDKQENGKEGEKKTTADASPRDGEVTTIHEADNTKSQH